MRTSVSSAAVSASLRMTTSLTIVLLDPAPGHRSRAGATSAPSPDSAGCARKRLPLSRRNRPRLEASARRSMSFGM